MVDFSKVEREAPALVSLAKKAAFSLSKNGVPDGQKAAVYLVLDNSGSMAGFYRNGDVQRLAEQALGLSVNLDDDGVVPVVFFGTKADHVTDVSLTDYAGVVDRERRHSRGGVTNYADAMDKVIKHYRKSKASDPALVVFQTDGDPYTGRGNARRDAEDAIRGAAGLPIFWAFVGFGYSIEFLQKLDTLTGRKVDNASFFHAPDPASVTNTQLYDGITKEFAGWLTAARNAGII